MHEKCVPMWVAGLQSGAMTGSTRLHCGSENRPAGVTVNRHAQLSIHDEPAYRAAEAAHILALPSGTLIAWCFGHDYRHRDGSPKRFVALIEPADRRNKLLSFTNLCELHVLAAIRRRHRIKMPAVRQAIEYVSRQLGVEHPLASSRFLTNGVGLFVEQAGELLNVTQAGQQAMREDFERALTRIEFADSGSAVVLFPFTRTPSSVGDQPRTVLVDPQRSFGRPVLAGAYVRTEIIEDRFRAGDRIADMALDFNVNETDIEEALRFESRQAA